MKGMKDGGEGNISGSFKHFTRKKEKNLCKNIVCYVAVRSHKALSTTDSNLISLIKGKVLSD